MVDLVIRGATDRRRPGPRAEARRPRGQGRPHRRHRRDQGQGRRDDRRRRARALARHRRRAHALRRAGHLGRHALALAVARRHHGGDRQLRLRHRAGAARRARPGDPQPLGRRGHGPRRAAPGHRLGFREFQRLHGDAAPPRRLRQPGRAGRPFDHPHRGDGRGRLAAQGRHAGRARHDEGHGGRRHGQGRDRARRLLFAQPFGLWRRADAVDHRADVGARRAGRRHGAARHAAWSRSPRA